MPRQKMTPHALRQLQRQIAESPAATRRVLRYLDDHCIEHSGRISGATLGAVCGVHGRTWRKWIGNEREIPDAAPRLLRLVARV